MYIEWIIYLNPGINGDTAQCTGGPKKNTSKKFKSLNQGIGVSKIIAEV